MEINKMNSQIPMTQSQTNFKGTFHINDPRVLSHSDDFCKQTLESVQNIEHQYMRKITPDKVTISCSDKHDLSVFTQLKELGLKFRALIGED